MDTERMKKTKSWEVMTLYFVVLETSKPVAGNEKWSLSKTSEMHYISLTAIQPQRHSDSVPCVLNNVIVLKQSNINPTYQRGHVL